jgi:hypothetical protein
LPTIASHALLASSSPADFFLAHEALASLRPDLINDQP